MPAIDNIKYINQNANSQSVLKAKGLFGMGAVKTKTYNEKSGVWTIQIQGTQLYTVKIYGTKSNVLSTSCTCPYNHGGICKHTVAALWSLSTVPNKEKIEKKEAELSSRHADAAFEIEEYQNITTQYISKFNKDLKDLPLYISRTWEINAHFSDDTLEVELFTGTGRQVVSIFYLNNKCYINSSERYGVKKWPLRKYEALVLYLIAKSEQPNLLDILFNKGIIDYKANAAKKYGIAPNEFDDFFDIKIHFPTGLVAELKPENKGLLPVTDADEQIPKAFEVFSDTKKNKTLPKKDERTLGFAIGLNRNGAFIKIIAGKPDKKQTKLSTNITDIETHRIWSLSIELSDNQKKIIESIQKHNDEYQSFVRILDSFSHEKYTYITEKDFDIRRKDLEPCAFSDKPIKLFFRITTDPNFLIATPALKMAENVLEINHELQKQVTYGVLIFENTVYHFENEQTIDFIEKYESPYKMVKTQTDAFFQRIMKPLAEHFEVDFTHSPFESEVLELDFSQKQIFLSEEEQYLIIRPQVLYNNKPVALSEHGSLIEKNNNKITEYRRNYELENDFIETLAELHPQFEMQKTNKVFYLHLQDFMKNMWFYKFFESMRKNHVEVYGLKDLKSFKYSPHQATINTGISSGQDWFDVEVNVSFGNQEVSLKDIRKAIINKQNYVLLKDGSVGILPEKWVQKLEKYFRNGQIQQNNLQVSKLRFSIIDELFENINETEIIEELMQKRAKLASFKSIEKVTVPKEIKAQLRNYQKEGLNWLNFLNQMQWGGILADDMGLGKTLQILTFVQQIIKTNKTPNLIVVPTTLLFNWEKEIEKFAPKIKAHFHYGGDRNQNTSAFDKHHLIFTTYGTLLRDIQWLKEFQFNYMILDESQAIKNPASRRFKTALLIKAKNKLALTGTPIENSTFDLYAQMSFVNPGLLGSIKQFRDNYSNPVDKEGNDIIAAELQKIINPFVLRRTKEQVATELPPKIEDVLYCDMAEKQRMVYDAYRNKYRDSLIKKIEEQGINNAKFLILEALTRLRQICDSPALLKDDHIETSESVKIKEIVNHITEKTSNHKILIFSQFVGMLSLLREQLEKRNIAYEYLDGKSSQKQREASVNNFQTNENLRVFLISLKAGGTGLNLTAADYVYILDPWWNPAVENQAIDRCYRIGQDKHVFAYRMICRNTIEEKIMNLQAKKKKIAADIIQTDENIIKNIDMNDIRDFLS